MKGPYIRTTITLSAQLLNQVDKLASEMSVSRSHLFVLAARLYLQRHENEKILRALNAIYSAYDAQERQVQLRHKRRYQERNEKDRD